MASKPMGVGGAMTVPGTSSNSPASSTSTLGYRETTFNPSVQLASQRAGSIEEGREWNFHQSPGGQSLPRILPADSLEESHFHGGLPAVTEAAPERGRNSPQTNARRSKRAPAPLLHKDTSRSSISSNLSFGSTTSSAMYTPITPVDDPRALRSLPGPSSTRFTATGQQSYFDQPPQPIHPPLPSISPPVYFPPRQTKSRVISSSGMNLLSSGPLLFHYRI